MFAFVINEVWEERLEESPSAVLQMAHRNRSSSFSSIVEYPVLTTVNPACYLSQMMRKGKSLCALTAILGAVISVTLCTMYLVRCTMIDDPFMAHGRSRENINGGAATDSVR